MFKLLNTDLKANSFIILAASLLFIPFIGNMPLFDWDEINFAECAREMIISKNYSDVQLYYQPFWEKPPLFIWLQAISMNIFGINEFAARLPNAICGILTLLVIFNSGKTLNNRKFGLTWSFVYAATLLPHIFFKSGIIDPWFNLFIYLSVFYLLKHTHEPQGALGYKTSLMAGFFLGLALLTKGPAALILVGLTVISFFVLTRFKKLSNFRFIAIFCISFLVTGFSWFAVEMIKGNSHIIKEFIDYQVRLFQTEDSSHGGPFIYHFVILLFGCFPSSILLIYAHQFSSRDTPYEKRNKQWMLCLFWVVLIVFSIVKTKIVHYSSLCYFPLTYLATYSIQKIIHKEWTWKKWIHIFFITITLIVGLVFILVTCIHFLKPWIISKNLIDDPFAVENLKADVYWNGMEWLIGVLFIGVTIFSIIKIRNGKLNFIYLLFSTSLITVYSLLMVIAPKIEQYSQHAAIEFFKACAQRNYYIETVNFKSYATLFYGNLQPDIKNDSDFIEYAKQQELYFQSKGENTNTYYGFYFRNWLTTGKITKPACFVAKCTEKDLNIKYPELTEAYRQNGYVFLVRMPKRELTKP